MKKLIIILLILTTTLFSKQNKVLIISTGMAKSTQSAKMLFLIREAKKQGLEVDYKFSDEITVKTKEDKLLQSGASKERALQKARQSLIAQYDLVMFDSLAGAMTQKRMLRNFEDIFPLLKDIKILPLIKEENPYLKNINIEDRNLIYDYWENGGITNTQNMFKYIQNNLLNSKNIKVDPPKILPKTGVYHPKYPDLVFNSAKEYFKYFNLDASKPVVAIQFSRNSIVSDILDPTHMLIKEIEDIGAIALPYYFDSMSKIDPIGMEFLKIDDKIVADSLAVFASFFIASERMKKSYDKLNIPILHGMFYRQGDQKHWEDSTEGMPFGSIAMSYIVPETMGYTDSFVIAAQEKITKEIKAIPYQMKSFASKAVRLAKLRAIKNENKKVAIVYYASPVNSVFASFLNIPKTVQKLLKEFKEKGYQTEDKNATWFEKQVEKTLLAYHKKDQEETMLEDNAAELLPFEKYMEFFENLPKELKDAMNKTHKTPENSKMVIQKDGKKYFLIPAIKVGNIVLMPQPNPERIDSLAKRSQMLEDQTQKEKKEDIHNATAPISHSYLASYLFIRNEFKADAIVHLGTHGNVEWTFGKARGTSIYDSPVLALGDMPHFYPYIMNNVAETLQVKRRARGVTISHLTPPFAITGTYNEISEIMELVNQYKIVTKGKMTENIKDQIIEKLQELNLIKDMEETVEHVREDFDHFLHHHLEEYINDMASIAQPIGLHTFGTYPKEKYLITTVIQMLGKEFLKKANGDNYAINDYQDFNDSKAFHLIKDYVIDAKDLNTLEDDDYRFYIKEAKRFYKSIVGQQENTNLFRALNGEHIKAGTGGGPIRNPESLPTGVNMVSFDPTKVPSKAAYKTGKSLMEEFIANFYEQNGVYPSKLTFNMWGLETVRHHGVMEAEIFAAMGVRPIWNEDGASNKMMQGMIEEILSNYLWNGLAKWIAEGITISRIETLLNLTPDSWLDRPKKLLKMFASNGRGRVEDVEIIPYSELKRPRIDVVVSATGLYRDTFPATMKLMAKAINKVAKLKEETNHIYLNAKKIEEDLVKKGLARDEAIRLSTIRIFSNKTGTYSAGVGAVQKSGNWKTDEVISEKYFKIRGHYFGADESKWDEQREDVNLFGKNLSGSESVIFSRSSNLYGLLTSDDPYGYFGSLSMAIRKLDGVAPKTYITNLRDPNNAKIQSTAMFMAQELRSRYFHPNWIKEMKKEGFSGAQEVSSVVSNFWGWQVVDPNVVRDDQWDEFVKVYIDDKYNLDLEKWFKDKNPQALANMAEKMIEAFRKDYWEADEETIKKLLALHDELEIDFKTKSFNLKFKEFKEKASKGFGLASLKQSATLAMKATKAKAMAKKAEAKVKGQKLEKVDNVKDDKDYSYVLFMLFILGIIASGMVYEWRRKHV